MTSLESASNNRIQRYFLEQNGKNYSYNGGGGCDGVRRFDRPLRAHATRGPGKAQGIHVRLDTHG